MKRLQGLKKLFASFENKKLKELDSVFGGKLPGTTTMWSQSSTSQWNCADIDTYVDGNHVQMTDDCSDPSITRTN